MSTRKSIDDMSGWNYRVIELSEGRFSLCEVYYYTDNSIAVWSTSGCEPYGDDLQDLKEELLSMLQALEKPTLQLIGGKLIEALSVEK